MVMQVLEQVGVELCDAGIRAPQGQHAAVRHCDACGAGMLVAIEARPIAAAWGAVWFCATCAGTFPAGEAERLARELVLRGVPLS